MNRYDEARAWLSLAVGADAVAMASRKIRALISGSPTDWDRFHRDRNANLLRLNYRHTDRVLSLICTVDTDPERLGWVGEHVSVAAHNPSSTRPELATWAELVAIRSISWGDDVEVHQVLPALEGPAAEPYVNAAEVLHLRRTR